MRSANIMEKRRVPILIISGIFFILSAVILLNLEKPRGASNSTAVSPAATPSDAPAAEQPAAASAPSETAEMKPAEPDAAAASTPPVTAPESAAPEPAAPAPPPATPPAVTPAVTPPTTTTPMPPGLGAVTESDLVALKTKALLIPVAGVSASNLRDTFNDGRSEGRQHQALDIMAAQGTPVVAATDGTVAKLFQSEKGGITLYQLDSSGLYYYYYAHLMRYADGIAEGQHLKRGDLVGYVGDTGNAGAGNYHLHFAISKPASPGKWSGGEAINPYPLLTGK